MSREFPSGNERIRELLEGAAADVPVSIAALRQEALDRLDGDIRTYLEAGAGGDRTRTNNRRGFGRWRIKPQTLRDVRERDHRTTFLGTTLPAPVGLAPVGFQTMFHPDGELATAAAAAELGLPMAVSSFASSRLETVAERLGGAPGWFQLYASHDDAVTQSLLERAEAAGYDAVVLTVDAHGFGWRERVLDRRTLPSGAIDEPANYFSDPAFRAALDEPPEMDPEAAHAHYNEISGPAVVDREDLERIASSTSLPVAVKGVLDPGDAETAVEAGADAVVVSNHGGRIVDNAVAAIDVLPDIVDRVGDRAEIGFDSGIRRGADAFVALALGADVVLLGRPYLYGLVIGGHRGVDAVLRNFLADLDMTLEQAGYDDWATVDRDAVVRADYPAR